MSCGVPVTNNGTGNVNTENNSTANNSKTDFAASANETMNEMKEKIGKYSNGCDNIVTIDGETVVGEAKWSLVALLIPFVLVFFGLIIYSNTPFSRYSPYGSHGMKVFTWIVYIVVLILSVWLFLFRRKLVITNKKIYARIGLIGIKQYTIPLDRINYLSVRYNIIDRIIGSANLVVCSGASLFPISFFFIKNARELRAILEQQMESYKKTL